MPTVEIRLVNVFLKPEEFAVLPVEVVPLWDDLDKVDREEKDPRRPLPTALLRIPLTAQIRTPDEADRAAYWLVTLLGFLTRRPCGADLQVTISDHGDRVGQRRLNGVAPQKRGGQAMFRTPEELRLVFNAAWHLWPEDSDENRRLHRALDWHNMARSAIEDKPIELSLIEHWIAIESLAMAWAKASPAGVLLSNQQVHEVRTELSRMAVRWDLPNQRVVEMQSKVMELARRPAKAVLSDYIRASLTSYGQVQPLGDELGVLIGTTIGWRNSVVHSGELKVDLVQGGIREVWHRMRQVDSLTERVLLACLNAEITFLTRIPWTYIMVGA